MLSSQLLQSPVIVLDCATRMGRISRQIGINIYMSFGMVEYRENKTALYRYYIPIDVVSWLNRVFGLKLFCKIYFIIFTRSSDGVWRVVEYASTTNITDSRQPARALSSIRIRLTRWIENNQYSVTVREDMHAHKKKINPFWSHWIPKMILC